MKGESKAFEIGAFLLVVAILIVPFWLSAGLTITAPNQYVGIPVRAHLLIPSSTFFESKTACTASLTDGFIYYTISYSGPSSKTSLGDNNAVTWTHTNKVAYNCNNWEWADKGLDAPFTYTGIGTGAYTLKADYKNAGDATLGTQESVTANFLFNGQPTTTTTLATTTTTLGGTTTTQGGGATTTTTVSTTTSSTVSTPPSTNAQGEQSQTVGTGNAGEVGDWFNAPLTLPLAGNTGIPQGWVIIALLFAGVGVFYWRS